VPWAIALANWAAIGIENLVNMLEALIEKILDLLRKKIGVLEILLNHRLGTLGMVVARSGGACLVRIALATL